MPEAFRKTTCGDNGAKASTAGRERPTFDICFENSACLGRSKVDRASDGKFSSGRINHLAAPEDGRTPHETGVPVVSLVSIGNTPVIFIKLTMC